MSAAPPVVELGRTGRRIARVGLGAMPLSLAGRPDREQAKAVVRKAVELGVDFIDTADVYCTSDADLGHNERLIAEALREVGGADRVVVATKGGRTRPGGRWEIDGRPEHLRAACERSLRALGRDCIDLYQLHTPDPAVPFAESVGALADLLATGWIAAVGLSNVTLAQLDTARTIVPITSVQNHFHPWDLGWAKGGMLERCDRWGITFLPYSPLGGARRVRSLLAAPALRDLGARLGASPAELTLAWMLTRTPSLVVIPGASRMASVESSVRAGTLGLDAETADAVERAFRRLPGQRTLLGRVAARTKRLLGLD